MRIFGREPAALVGVLEGVLALLLSFGLFDLTQDRVGAIVAAVAALFGLLTAYLTKDTLLGVAVGLAKALLVLGATYGLHVSTEQNGAILAVITVLIGFWQRGQTSPAVVPSFSDDPAPPQP